MTIKKKAALRANQAASDNAFDPGNIKLPCTVEQYRQMRPYPVEVRGVLEWMGVTL